MEALDKAIEKLRAREEEVLRAGGSVPASQVGELISEAIRALESCKQQAGVWPGPAAAAAVKQEGNSDNGGSEEGSSPPIRRGRGKGSGQQKRGVRRRSHPYSSCREITSHTLDDGFPWRKYGQKEILSSKFPRNYYRCTHKYSKKCPAARQTQIMEDDPSMHRITYIGHHTCVAVAPSKETEEPIRSSDHPLAAAAGGGEKCVISFEQWNTSGSLAKEVEEVVEVEIGRLNTLALASPAVTQKERSPGPWAAVDGGEATPTSSRGQSPLSSPETDLGFYFELDPLEQLLPFFDEHFMALDYV